MRFHKKGGEERGGRGVEVSDERLLFLPNKSSFDNLMTKKLDRQGSK